MSHCRGCGNPIPPRRYAPAHCGPACVDLAVERAITKAIGPKAPANRRKGVTRCARCGADLPPKRLKFCSAICVKAHRADAKSQATTRWCLECGNDLSPKHLRFCSRICSDDYKRAMRALA